MEMQQNGMKTWQNGMETADMQLGCLSTFAC